MEPSFFYVGAYFLVSLLHLASSRVDNYGGWNNAPGTQYHIQTDEGEERYFKYQTKSGQYRKEKRLQDGTVVGTYGWVDPNGYLRLRDYVADDGGYRIVKTRIIYVGRSPITDKTVAAVKNYPSKYDGFSSQRTTLQQNPFAVQSNQLAYVPPSTYHPSRPPIYLSTSQATPRQPPQTTHLPPEGKNVESSAYQSTPASTFLRRPGELSPLLQIYPSSTPIVDVSPNSIPKSSTPLYASATTPSPVLADSTAGYLSTTPGYLSSSPPSIFLEAKSSSNAYSSTTTPPPVSSPGPYYSTPTPSPSSAAVHSSTPRPVSVDYLPALSPATEAPSESISAIGYINSSPPPVVLSPPIDNYSPNNNFITETKKNNLFFRNNERNYYKKRYVEYQSNAQEYDGISTVQNGFRYFLPRQYHEELSSSDGQERAGSFGYIDPFGIRRVIYYNTAPGSGFVHRKNNRYVGFDSTPYDPRPY